MSKTEPIVNPENEPNLAADPERLLGKVAREHRRDGATDAMLGGLFLTVGLIHARWGSSAFDSGIAPLGTLLLAIAVLVLMLWLWKQKITYPRLGYAKIVTPQWRGRKPWEVPFIYYSFLGELAMRRRAQSAGSRIGMQVLGLVMLVAMLFLRTEAVLDRCHACRGQCAARSAVPARQLQICLADVSDSGNPNSWAGADPVRDVDGWSGTGIVCGNRSADTKPGLGLSRDRQRVSADWYSAVDQFPPQLPDSGGR